MYLPNKYTTWYLSIISKASKRTLVEEYTEIHHIIPKSLGGSNDPSNLVKLTAREHFVCHMLLTKMVEGNAKQKMVYAWWAMANQKRPDQHRYKVSSRIYKIIKEAATKNHSMYRHSDTAKQKLSTARKGLEFSPGWRDNMSKGAKNRTANRVTPFGRKMNCPHCGKVIALGNYHRWHGDNCKSFKIKQFVKIVVTTS